jgi:hypothetical protein
LIKSELRNGMLVFVKSKEFGPYVVCKDTCQGDILISKTGWVPLKTYDEDLTDNTGDRRFDIIDVYELTNGWSWEAKAYLSAIHWHIGPVRLTLAEIETILGYPIEIVEKA